MSTLLAVRQCHEAPACAAWGSVDLAPRALRDLLGSYPTGVAIVTTRAADGRNVGLTINSFASLSLDPPLVLWSLVNPRPTWRCSATARISRSTSWPADMKHWRGASPIRRCRTSSPT